MVIKKVLNNNTLLVEFNNNEFVIIGKGIGFNKINGDIVDEKLIEKKFATYNIPLKFYEISKDIIQTAENRLNISFNPIIYFSLTDHIYSAINRYYENIVLKNSLLNEIKIMYKEEFNHSLDSIKYIYNELGILLPEDEAGFITMHFINASLNKEKNLLILNSVYDLLDIIEKFVTINKSKENNYFRLITHLKYFVIQKIDNIIGSDENQDIYELIEFKYSYLIEIIIEIEKYIHKKFNQKISKSEAVLIMLYIKSTI